MWTQQGFPGVWSDISPLLFLPQLLKVEKVHDPGWVLNLTLDLLPEDASLQAHPLGTRSLECQAD